MAQGRFRKNQQLTVTKTQVSFDHVNQENSNRMLSTFIPLMEEIPNNQLIGSLSHSLQILLGFIHPRWCSISFINSMFLSCFNPTTRDAGNFSQALKFTENAQKTYETPEAASTATEGRPRALCVNKIPPCILFVSALYVQ